MTLWLLALAYLALINLVTFQLWAADKRRAIRRERRVPEDRLLLMCALGGWPAALLATRMFRHKSSKRSFGRKFVWLMAAQATAVVATIIAIKTF
ncbi:MAG: DUF1294 domain-containing protein [Asticcacaulis sp.]